MRPEFAQFRTVLLRASRRRDRLATLRGGAIGLTVALGVALALLALGRVPISTFEALGVAITLATAGFASGAAVWVASRKANRSVAADIERLAPQCRNVVITAAELMDDPQRASPPMAAMICDQARHHIVGLDLRTIFPARRVSTLLATVCAVWLIVLIVIGARPAFRSGDSATIAVATLDDVELVIEPPAYSGQPKQVFRDISRVDVLAGSVIHLKVRANAASVGVETLAGRQSLVGVDGATTLTTRSRTFTGDVVADADGFIAVAPLTSSGRVGIRRLIGLSVTADRLPHVRITVPGKDIVLTKPTGSIDVTIDADDDLGLASLALRYTRVSGSGEKFSFVEGEVPISVTHTDLRVWKGRGTLRLDPFKLEPGDMVVYRAVAADRRPSAPSVESDAFLVEISAPGMVASEGFALDDNEDKYAISQQMVILKTERLIARARSIAADSVVSLSQNIAAEQRAVRAQFVFMMGGELAEDVIAAAGMTDLNEEAEAAGEADIAAGRLANHGRVALVQAIRFMSRASTSLNAADPPKALAEEKAALGYLQQAFSRTRYLLRALTQRERLDLSRRLTGTLLTAVPDSRGVVTPLPDPRAVALRDLIIQVAALAGQKPFRKDVSPTVASLAQRILAVDPSAIDLQKAAVDLNSAAAALDHKVDLDARALLDTTVGDLTIALRRGRSRAPDGAPSLDTRRLQGNLNDALRRAVIRR